MKFINNHVWVTPWWPVSQQKGGDLIRLVKFKLWTFPAESSKVLWFQKIYQRYNFWVSGWLPWVELSKSQRILDHGSKTVPWGRLEPSAILPKLQSRVERLTESIHDLWIIRKSDKQRLFLTNAALSAV